MRKKIVAGNWKMNMDWQQGQDLADAVVSGLAHRNTDVIAILGTPYVHLQATVQKTQSLPKLSVAAQNCHQEEAGAYTGEISAAMLKSIGVEYVILGHSERREYFEESNELLSQKVNTALAHDLIPIFCCGEPLSIRESGQQEEYVNHQLTASLFHLEADQIARLAIAYEPIWAIGTGKTASAEQAQEMHQAIRNHLATKFGQEIADNLTIMYGGSCKPSNAREIFAGPDVDGGLIGGASLKAEDFLAIIDSM
jgi:triosephosphate isomerase